MVDSLVKFGVDFKSEDEIAITVLVLEISGSLDAGIAELSSKINVMNDKYLLFCIKIEFFYVENHM